MNGPTVEIRVGDRLRRNQAGGVVVVTRVTPEHVWYRRAGICRSLLRRRIYTDGKPRKSGFSLLPREAA